jgi:hypothetical protein
MITEPEQLIDRALAYARRGWPVFPCRPGGKEPATCHGFRDATTDADQIRHWWRRQPRANIAVATGLPGPDVLDVDDHGDAGTGYPAYCQLDAAGLLEGAGAVVATPHDGLHIYFAGSRQATRRLVRHHLDFRAVGGCVLVPPSRVGGIEYRLIRHGGSLGGLDWSAVTTFLEPQRDQPSQPWTGQAADTSRLATWVGQLEEGNRNSGLFWAACRAVEAAQFSLLDELAAAAARTGLPEREITRTIDSARRTGLSRCRRESGAA